MNFFTQLREVIAGLSLVRKVSMILIVGIAVGVVSMVVHLSRASSLEPLYTNLNSQDMGSIITLLDKQGVSYEVDQEKRTVMVPSTKVLDLRLKLADEGLPRFGGVGFELFDKGGFGMSEFEQKVNYQRALEGELSRTIGGIREVESARVHLVLPEKTLFSESHGMASASVILKLGGSSTLAQPKVSAITHIVASAVEGLDADHVTVMDTAGRLLTSSAGGDSSVAAGSQVFDQKIQIEHSYERRIVELLSPIVGLGKVIAHVSATIDFTHSESTDEVVDPNKVAVLNESHTTSKKTEGASGTGGAAGAAANLPGGGGGGAGTGSSGTADEGTDQFSYQVSKSVRHQVTPSGAIKSLSLAILVDGVYTTAKDGKKTYAARPPDELKKMEDLIKSAVGFSADRGDQIKVENMAFQTPEEQIASAEAWYKQKTTYGFLSSAISNFIIVLSFLLLLFFVIRPMVRGYVAATNPGLLTGGATGALASGDGSDVKVMVQSNPQAAANAIREWLK